MDLPFRDSALIVLRGREILCRNWRRKFSRFSGRAPGHAVDRSRNEAIFLCADSVLVRSSHSQTIRTLHPSARNLRRFAPSLSALRSIFDRQYSAFAFGGRAPLLQLCPRQKRSEASMIRFEILVEAFEQRVKLGGF